jgi:hypothetical protein
MKEENIQTQELHRKWKALRSRAAGRIPLALEHSRAAERNQMDQQLHNLAHCHSLGLLHWASLMPRNRPLEAYSLRTLVPALLRHRQVPKHHKARALYYNRYNRIQGPEADHSQADRLAGAASRWGDIVDLADRASLRADPGVSSAHFAA